MSQAIAPGAHIKLRDVVWRVLRVERDTDGQQVWRCQGVSELVRDQEAVFLQRLEPEVRVLDPHATTLVRDRSPQHRAGRLYIEALLRDLPPPDDGLYVGHRAAMDALPFQLEPAWMALQQLRPRILIADAVGLGKTLEAGVLLSELIRRGRARRILVCTTKAMLTQFQKELWARFTIPLVRLDSQGLARIREEIPSHHNPFNHFDRSIISVDTLKQNNWFRTHVEQARWDVIVIDEAHNVASRGSGSQRSQIAKTLAKRCDSLILLSATPHDGKAESFASLMNMLDPTAIADPSDYQKEDIRGLFVRRFKHDVADQLQAGIPEREVLQVQTPASTAEEAAYAKLAALRLPELDRGETGGVLYRTGLAKALLSSPAACLQQLKAPLRRARVKDKLPASVRARIPDLDPAEALREAADALGGALGAELRSLADLAQALAAIGPEDFSKYQRLLRVLTELKWSPRRKDDRLVIFTERMETLKFLSEHLPQALGLKPEQSAILHGGLSDLDQQKIVESFGQEQDKLRLLLASDVASEGLNLHYLCHRMVHFDVPWSLMVFQQRNGRIDRYGQTQRPQIVYLMTRSQLPQLRGDNHILKLLIDKDAQVQKNIGDPSMFLNEYTVEGEERLTALAMQEGSTDRLEQAAAAAPVDPFQMMLQGAAVASEQAPERSAPTLHGDAFGFMTAGLEHLATAGVKAKVQPGDKLIELTWPDDLRRRFRKLPKEVRPDDGVLLLTGKPSRMQRALDEARRSESSWPQHQLLWDNSPVLAWLVDRLRGLFGRHAAPILSLPQLPPGEVVFIISGMISNRRGQPRLHRWYAARVGEGGAPLTPFEDFLAQGALSHPLTNRGEDIDPAPLQAALPAAVDAVDARMREERQAALADLSPRLDAERDRLEAGLDKQLALFQVPTSGPAADRAQLRQERIRRRFEDHRVWAEQSLQLGKIPFIQVIAALVGPGA